jgi:hypothetical protein
MFRSKAVDCPSTFVQTARSSCPAAQMPALVAPGYSHWERLIAIRARNSLDSAWDTRVRARTA